MTQMDILSDTLDWLTVKRSPLDQFINQLDGQIVISNEVEVVVITPVPNLLRLLTPIQDFYLVGQRSVDEDRVEEMYKYQAKEYQSTGHYSITSTMISLGYCSSQDKPKLLDGQHRAAVMRRLLKFFPETLSKEVTFVKILKADTETDLLEYFQTINRNYVPVPVYNLDETMRDVIDGVLKWFKKSFDASFFKTPPTGQVQRPFINLDGCCKNLNLRDWLSNNPRIQELIAIQNGAVEQSIQLICGKLNGHNNVLKNLNPEDFMISEDDRACLNAHTKCLVAQKQLFLGLKKNYELIEESLIKKTIRIKIPSLL